LRGGYYYDIMAKDGHSIEARPRNGSPERQPIVMRKTTVTPAITVPVPNNKETKFGTLKSIIRQSQVSSVEFEA